MRERVVVQGLQPPCGTLVYGMPGLGVQMAPSPLSSFAALPRAGRLIGRAGRLLLDLLVPPQCLACGETMTTPQALCGRCWPQLRFIGRPMCAVCGIPLEFDLGREAVCGACARRRPRYARACAALVYDGASRPLILAFKNSDRTDAAPAFARWMTRAGGGVLEEADGLVPVPLHWTRLFARRYNQAALLAAAIGRLTSIPVHPDALLRTRRTDKMRLMGASARARNVAGVFATRASARAWLHGRSIVLVDDVMTTGATTDGCVGALLAAGARQVSVLTLARTVRDATDV
ncbi:MAG: ComF family protein [Rhodospirillales bacterium]